MRTPESDNPPVIRPPPPRPPPPRPPPKSTPPVIIPPPPPEVEGDCSCSTYVTKKGWGDCRKDLHRKGPICYVNEPSTCNDVRTSKIYNDRRYSWEACQNNLAKIIPQKTELFSKGNLIINI